MPRYRRKSLIDNDSSKKTIEEGKQFSTNFRRKVREETIAKKKSFSQASESTRGRLFNKEISNLNTSTVQFFQSSAKNLLSEDNEIVLKTLKETRRVLANDLNPPINEALNSRIVLEVIKKLSLNVPYEIAYEATWIITNIASGRSEAVLYLVDNGAMPKLVDLLSSDNKDLRDQAIWAVGNIAGDEPTVRDFVLNSGAFEKVFSHLSSGLSSSMKSNVCWTLSNFCRGTNPKPDYEKVRIIMPVVAKVIAEFCGKVRSLFNFENINNNNNDNEEFEQNDYSNQFPPKSKFSTKKFSIFFDDENEEDFENQFDPYDENHQFNDSNDYETKNFYSNPFKNSGRLPNISEAFINNVPNHNSNPKMNYQNEQISICDCLYSLAILLENERNPELPLKDFFSLENDFFKEIIFLIGHFLSNKIVSPSLRIIGAITMGSNNYTDRIVEEGAIEAIVRQFQSSSKKIISEMCWVLSNIIATGKNKAKRIIETSIHLKLIEGYEFRGAEIKSEIAYLLHCLIKHVSDEELGNLVNSKLINFFLLLVQSKFYKPKKIGLLSLKIALEKGENFMVDGVNPVTKILEEVGGVNVIEDAQEEKNESIYELAAGIVRDYFGGKEEEEYDVKLGNVYD